MHPRGSSRYVFGDMMCRILRDVCSSHHVSSYSYLQLTKEVIDEKQSVNKGKASIFFWTGALSFYVYYLMC